MRIEPRVRKLEADTGIETCTCPDKSITTAMDAAEAMRLYRQLCQCKSHKIDIALSSDMTSERATQLYQKFIYETQRK